MKYYGNEQYYVDYISSIWGSLPASLKLLCDRRTPFSPEKVYLNDSNIQSINAEFDRKTIEIVLLGEALDWNVNQIGERWFTLSYSKVQKLTSEGKYRTDIPFMNLPQDHVWDEVEVLEN